jgi:glycosyltransferase involved in cell wall biosynthesis
MSREGAATIASEKIRIVHCIGSLRTGGAEKQLTEIIVRLPRERFEQSLMLLQPGGGPLAARIERAGCEILSLGYDGKFSQGDWRSPFKMLLAFEKLRANLRRRRPAILHAQLFWANAMCAFAGKLAGVPKLVVSHRQLSDHKRGRRIPIWLENFSNARAAAVVVNSEAVRRDILANDKVDPAKLHRIYNGVVLEDFKPADLESLRGELRLLPKDFVLAVVANLHPYKGHEDLLRAAGALLPKHPGLKILLAGRDQGSMPSLRELARELDLNNAVQFLGERSDVPALLQAADVVVHPSHQEGFSNSILEAMAAGKPVVATDAGGNPEQVRDGENGLIVPARAPEALAAAIDRLAGDPALRARMGAASRARIEGEFSIERTVAETARLYESLAARP